MHDLSPHARLLPARRGLAPLELVLALPLLLFMMALIVNFGVVASWRVRGQAAARHAAWATRPHLGSVGAATPRPNTWPSADPNNPEGSRGAALNAGVAADALHLDLAFPNHSIARGPSVDGAGGPSRVLAERLDLDTGFRFGESTLNRRFPLLQKLGEYTLTTRVEMLTDEWTDGFHGLWSDDPIGSLWQFARRDDLASAYRATMEAIYRAYWPNCRPIRDDIDPTIYRAKYGTRGPLNYFDLRNYGAVSDLPDVDPDKPPLLEIVRDRVNDTIEAIKGKASPNPRETIAARIADDFVHYYDSVIERIKLLLGQPNPPPYAQSDLQEVLRKREQMQQYRNSIH